MKNIAIIKFAGMAPGGVEKYLQTLSFILKDEGHNIDFYYTNAARHTNGWVHPDNSIERINLCETRGINLIPVHVDYRISEWPNVWMGTNFWEKFKESDYDVIQTGRGGYPEYPFNEIRNTPIIDSIHSFVGNDQPNIKKAILLCKWQADKWASNGGNISKAVIIPSIVYVPEKRTSLLKQKLGIPEDRFIFGFHQANRSDIFSPNSLIAYSKIENDKTHFVMLGGCDQHKITANQLKIKNISFVDFATSTEEIHDFLSILNVYTHARSDGEVCSAAMIEAMYHGLPIISHPALNMGHAEQLEGCGKLANTLDEYYNEMIMLMENKDYYKEKQYLTMEKYKSKYDYRIVEQQIKELYKTL